MVIIERHGSNKLENKLCCSPLLPTEGQKTTEVLFKAPRKRRTLGKTIVSESVQSAACSSNTLTSTSAGGPCAEFLSAGLNHPAVYDANFLAHTSTCASLTFQTPRLPSACPEFDDRLASDKHVSPEALHSSFAFVNTSTLDASTPKTLSVQTASFSNHDSSAHSSIFRDTTYGNFHWRKRKRKSVVADITSSFYSYLFGCERVRVSVLYLILFMCALIEGCVCSNMCAENPKVLPEFLRVDVNKSSPGPVQGQCLRVTNEFVEHICDLPKADRMKAIRKVNTNFCGLPLYNLLNNTEKDIIEQCSANYGCASTLRFVQDLDTQLSETYCSFTDIIDRMDCEDNYSTNGNCHSCREAYKQWLCSVHFDYYQGGVPLKPCIQLCDQVTRYCPFFRPSGETTIGEPGFLCKDIAIYNEDAAAIYGQESCCYEPCQVFIVDDWNQGCPQLNITSNCTSAIIQNRACAHLGLNLYLALGVMVTWIIMALSRYSCIGLT